MAKETADRATIVAFVAKLLKSNPDMSFSEMKKASKEAGHHIYPLIVGLARKELGWVRNRTAAPAPGGVKRGPGRPPKNAVAVPGAPMKRGPGRPPKARPSISGDAAGALAAVEREFAAMREALRAIADVASRF
jgi:hypothetical protein